MRILTLIFSIFLITACYSTPPAHTPPPQHGQLPPPPPGFPQQSPQQGENCGGLAGFSCSNPSDYCAFSPQAQCGAADQMGTCSPRPEMCTEQYQPVCGCDGKTYSNTCKAAGAGTSVVHDGQCRN